MSVPPLAGNPIVPSLLVPSLLLTALLLPGVATAAETGPTNSERLFARAVAPLLKEKCLACHGLGDEEPKGGLDLRSREALLRGGDSGEPGAVSGRPDASPLVKAVLRGGDEYSAMPPKDNDKLSAEQIAALRQWIAGGLPWPSDKRLQELAASSSTWDADGGVTVATSGGLSPDWTNRRYKPENLWPYRPLVKPPLPRAADQAAGNPIDAFVDAGLARRQLSPAPPADRPTLIRRATLDLIGLPPSPAEVEAFLKDPGPDREAFAKVVERLLASPHYGEQWGRHWLDVVRYADSSGYANDYQRGNAWRYRDYVVRAFNDDKPYDRFIREQIAGDELEPESVESRVATGFLRMGAWELTAMEVPKIARQRYLDDVTETVGQVFFAHQVQCARCHDHKFDPVPTRDYYRLQAVFATTQLAERPTPFLASENRAGFEERKYLQQRQAHYRQILDRLGEKAIAGALAWYAAQKLDPAPFKRLIDRPNLKARHDDQMSRYEAARRKLIRDGVAENRVPPRQAAFTPEDFGLERVARKGLEQLVWQLESYEPVALAVYSGRSPPLKSVTSPLRMPADPLHAGELEATHILPGGDPYSPKDKVWPGALSAAGSSAGDALGWPELESQVVGRRSRLAGWLSDPHNPLPARVMVNRIWLWHFGQALAGNPNNFGATGQKPTHPELLDWLAAEFIEQGWSVKSLHRAIMLSETYRRSSRHPDPAALVKQDPTLTSYAVLRPRRLEAEELRDAMLAVSGELRPEIGGIPVRPEIHPQVALQPRQVMGTFAPAWQPSPLPSQRHRRSIYALRLRGLPDPQMEVFNQPGTDTSCELREVSTVTPQVFALFNSQSSYDRALAFAARLLREAHSRGETIDRAFRLAFGRPPSESEAAACLAHWSRMTERQRGLKFDKRKYPQRVVREAVEENTGETFRFSEPLEVYADFVPDLQPADADATTRALADVCLVLLNANEFLYVY
jgi:mono/diheme cytochrome c family protein